MVDMQSSISVKSSPPGNWHPAFYGPDALPVAQPTVTEHWKEIRPSTGGGNFDPVLPGLQIQGLTPPPAAAFDFCLTGIYFQRSRLNWI